MDEQKNPDLSEELLKRITIVRRDLGNLLWHFTRKPSERFVEVKIAKGHPTRHLSGCASSVLTKILHEEGLKGTSKWSNGQICVCFTEAPIQEFNSVFSLVEIASSQEQRPRYEPYGIGVSKKWLFARGGRPVIYDHPDALDSVPEEQRYRFVEYDPTNGVDFTWEREWRIRTDYLRLDPRETLVVVPKAQEAFELVYEFGDLQDDSDWDAPGVCYTHKWLAVSLDLFGFRES